MEREIILLYNGNIYCESKKSQHTLKKGSDIYGNILKKDGGEGLVIPR